ncbi:Hypothetical protein CINCED_3A007996 [Cinara cedri]|uniref:Uncharacterized protein n=1 Tax=Cinara cedri TaxID=506608 RepID=A0A5E4N7P9_9HEMI|nr:Hypothetical protein CINCED_3A007996 [Cinara cedri]
MILTKLAGTSWGCKANVLRTSAMALVYSVSEYYAPVWGRNTHCKSVDSQLKHTMRIITGAIKSNNIQWLLVLVNIAQPDIRH